MFNGFIITENDVIRQECEDTISLFPNLDIKFFNHLSEINFNNGFSSVLFLLVTEIEENHLPYLKEAQLIYPGVTTLVYNNSLSISKLNDVSELKLVRFVAGENRQDLLKELIAKIKEDYWRTIPFEKFGIKFNQLSSRLQRALRFIESTDIRSCNIQTIAEYLNISPGYFSQEFKKETGLSFRRFMQRVLYYYEDIILLRGNIPTKNISKLLGYSELSSFSRSFKKRKGISPTQFRKLIRV